MDKTFVCTAAATGKNDYLSWQTAQSPVVSMERALEVCNAQ